MVAVGSKLRHFQSVEALLIECVFSGEEEAFSTDVCAAEVAPRSRRSGTGDAFCCTTAAKTWSHDAFVSKLHKKKPLDGPNTV